jgi:hypothetical protein
MSNKLLLLGGYGGVGRTLARVLLQETNAEIIIAGRHKEKADEVAAMLNREFPGDRAIACYADASNQVSLIKTFRDIRLVIVLTTTPDLIKPIGKAALAAGCDYLDILVSESTFDDLHELHPLIQQQNRIFITQAGFHPGLPAVFIRYGAQFFDKYEKAIIAMAMNTRFERAEQAVEIIAMVSEFKADIYREGSWKRATYSDAVIIDMGKRFGRMQLFPIQMTEIRQMAGMFDLTETGAYVSGFNWFVDYFFLPIILISQKIRKGWAIGLLTRLFTWGVNTFSSSDQGVVFLNEAEGTQDGKKKKVRIIAEHDDANLFTAVPVVACLKQYLNGLLPSGLWMMGHVVDEKTLFSDIEKMGIVIRTETANTSAD